MIQSTKPRQFDDTDMADGIANRKFSSREVVQANLARIAETNVAMKVLSRQGYRGVERARLGF